MSQGKICKFYVKGNCKDGENCKFRHENNICRNYFFGECKRDNCKFKHTEKLQNGKRKGSRRKNTESFKPCYDLPDVRVLVANPYRSTYQNNYYSRDVVLAHNLFCDVDDYTIYDNLLEEIKATGKEDDGLWKLWHGDSHLIADDHIKWKESCPTFNIVLNKIKNYFRIDIKATRLNWYRNSTEWKPYHHDAAAVNPKIAKTQNLTIGISFGAERDIAFQHAKSKNVVSFPQPNGSVYGFAKDVNIIWRHGIPQLPPEKQSEEGRISIIAWGWSKLED